MKCFVIMPFGDPSDDADYAAKQETIYQWIKATVESIEHPAGSGVRVECHRADKEVGPGEIISHLVENLIDADIVIADLSGKNANVFYELGVRHALRYNSILITQDWDDVPFDLRSLRTIVYKYEPRPLLDLADALRKAVGKVLTKFGEPDNPVRKLIESREMEKKRGEAAGADGAIRGMAAEVSSLRRELQSFKTYFDELRDLTQVITSGDKQVAAPGAGADALRRFEGIWKRKDGTTHCMRVIGGKLAVAYCYMDDSHLTGHFYNCTLIGTTLFARFEWFARPVSGLIFFKKKSSNFMTGGWWYSHDVPPGLLKDISRVDESVPGMVRVDARRSRASGPFPPWAEMYFKEVESGVISKEFRLQVMRTTMSYYK
ncbi:MAG: hypothetical protein M3416_17300 [Acidobacteriota bacterium]|nr:hypothetical protein [Acidobacteriota bacterium]